MKYLVIPVFLFFLVFSGCASPKPKSSSDVKVTPQESLPAEPGVPAQETPAVAAEPAPASAAKPVVTEPAEETGVTPPAEDGKFHTVGIFESLWSIAEKEYSDGRLWEKIYEANLDQISDPNKIFPKQELLIPPLEE